MPGFTHVEGLSSADVQRLRETYEPLAQSVRELIDATIRSEVDGADVAAAKAHIDAAIELLRAEQIDGPFGVRVTSDGDRMPWGNPAIGIRNAIAPPLRIVRGGEGGGEGVVSAAFHLGAAYEGPPGQVHGGIVAMVLDHVLGEVAASDPNTPRFTGTLTIRYLRATPLGDLRAEGRITRTDGIKTFAVGHVYDAEGITAEAEGVFIPPKWARG
ncbi:PaaI family thioesterase [Mycolicibacterium goodii]|uniref:Acyl-coenzyme A thioesterase THEM4 n=1 Tax=Mycolicibacterium goodii TaxID=134601 RepID=A0A0K0X9Q0_MYCGD|nr:thioesterase [Mycolicibacterium goodii]